MFNNKFLIMKRNLLIEIKNNQNNAYDINSILGNLKFAKLDSLIIYYDKEYVPLFFYYTYEYTFYVFNNNLESVLGNAFGVYTTSSFYAYVNTKVLFNFLKKFHNINHNTIVRLSIANDIYFEAENIFFNNIHKIKLKEKEKIN